MGVYKVDPTVLVGAAQKMNTIQVEFGTEYSNLIKNLDELTQKDFVSTAANTYRNAINEFIPEFKKMQSTIENYGVYCISVVNETDATNSDISSNIGNY